MLDRTVYIPYFHVSTSNPLVHWPTVLLVLSSTSKHDLKTFVGFVFVDKACYTVYRHGVFLRAYLLERSGLIPPTVDPVDLN